MSTAPSQELDQQGQETDPFDEVRATLREIDSRPDRDDAGRFLPGNSAASKGLDRSSVFWSEVSAARAELVERLHADLAVDDGATAATLEGLTSAYAETRLLRHAMFARLVDLGGPVTSKGKARALLSSYFSAVDRERRLALDLGLSRRSKSASDPLDALEQAVADANGGAA